MQASYKQINIENISIKLPKCTRFNDDICNECYKPDFINCEKCINGKNFLLYIKQIYKKIKHENNK